MSLRISKTFNSVKCTDGIRNTDHVNEMKLTMIMLALLSMF